VPVATWAFGGLAATGVGIFTGFGLAGNAAEGCAPTCTRSQVASIRTDFLVADVSLAAAIAAGGAAAYFALTARPESAPGRPAPPATAWWLGVRPEAGGASLAASGAF
jgi:hypothetical protein